MRIQKRISFGNLFNLNLSKSGASLSIGKKGLSFNISKRGISYSIGYPGSGISQRKALVKFGGRRRLLEEAGLPLCGECFLYHSPEGSCELASRGYLGKAEEEND